MYSLSPRRRWFVVGLGLSLLVAGGCDGCRRAPELGRDAGAPVPLPAPASAPVDRSATLFGGERGLDHVGVAVKDLDAASRTYQEILGFSRPVAGKLPNGISNVNYYFADATYLETLTHYDRGKATWLAQFTDRHNGALFAVLSVFSVDATAAFLRRRGLGITKPVPGTIQTVADQGMPEEKWRTFNFAQKLLPGDPLYFIAYNRRGRDEYLEKLRDRRARRVLRHDNTALGLKSVWLAVDDLPRATAAFTTAGFTPGRAFTDPRLRARGQEMRAGNGAILLLASAAADGAVAAFLKERGGPGLMGMTIEAGSVPVAVKHIGDRTGRTFTTYAGLLGVSALVPPELTHGVWLEFAQRPGRRRP